VKVIHVDARSSFMRELAGVRPRGEAQDHRPEFVEVFQREAKKLHPERAKWLAQGTIYPDVIESAGAKTKKATPSSRTTTSAGCPRRCT
jgi:GMP synthase (glutamine-hydrolysing)